MSEESSELLRLLPTEGGYAAKPSHVSYSDGVKLVRHDPITGRMAISTNREDLKPISKGGEKMQRNVVALTLSAFLHRKPRDDDSWTLHNVEPGVVIEEQFTMWDIKDDTTPAVEFKCFNVWGRVVFALWKRGLVRPGIVTRDGTLANWSEKTEMALPKWLDWNRVVELSERLASHKDIYRDGIYAGIEAGSPALRPGATQEERMNAIRYAVSETEIYPTTAVDDEVHAEAAQLWIAGYKAGNYRNVKNTEVPEVFLKKGFMPDDKLSSVE